MIDRKNMQKRYSKSSNGSPRAIQLIWSIQNSKATTSIIVVSLSGAEVANLFKHPRNSTIWRRRTQIILLDMWPQNLWSLGLDKRGVGWIQ